jgi:hypothetical protein
MIEQNLPQFFRAMTAFLDGTGSLQDTILSMGDSPSRHEQFYWYRSMVQGNPLRLLETVYDIVKTHAGDDIFKQICIDHLTNQKPDHWDLPRLALGFRESAEKVVARDSTIPVTVGYLADWEELLFQLRTFATAPMQADGLNPTLELRQYSFDVRGYRNAVRKGEKPAIMEERDVIYLAYRQVDTSRIKVIKPSVPELLLIAFGQGELSVEEFRKVDLPTATVDSALAALKKKQIVGADFAGPLL